MLTNVVEAAVMAAGMLGLVWCLMKLRKEKPQQDDPWPFEAVHKGQILSEAEWYVFERLSHALDKHFVLCQVPMGRLVAVSRKAMTRKMSEVNWSAKIERRTLDYVVCTADGQVAAVVELDDASDKEPGRQREAAEKDKALSSAGVHVVRWTMRSLPKRDEEIREAILEPNPKNAEGELEGGEVIEPLPRLA